MFATKRLLIAAGVAVIAIIAVIVGVLLGINSHTAPDHKSVKNEKFEAIVDGMTAPEGLPPNGILVAPASEENWYGMFPYASRVTYLNMPYEAVGENATHIISISANGTNDEQSLVIGSFKYPVMGVVYETERQADQAKERVNYVMDQEPYLTDAKFFTKGNILYFILQATFTDDQMSVENLPSSLTAADLNSWGAGDGEAYWYINFGAFMESYKETLEEPGYGEGVDKILAKAGITENTYWVGTSKDLTVWDGKFYNIDVSGITPKDFMNYFSRFYKKIDVEDRSKWEYFSLTEVWPDESKYEIEPAQSVLGEYTEVATKRGVAGFIDTPIDEDAEEQESESPVEGERGGSGENKPTLEKLPEDSPYFAKVKIDPNAWVGFLRGGSVLQAPRTLFIKTLTAEVKLNGEARITVEPYTMEEYYADIAESESGAESFAEEQKKINEEAGVEGNAG